MPTRRPWPGPRGRVRNASPAHRVAALHEREGASERIALTMQKSFRGMKAALRSGTGGELPRGNHLYAIDATQPAR